jgi:hypothetical protein
LPIPSSAVPAERKPLLVFIDPTSIRNRWPEEGYAT